MVLLDTFLTVLGGLISGGIGILVWEYRSCRKRAIKRDDWYEEALYNIEEFRKNDFSNIDDKEQRKEIKENIDLGNFKDLRDNTPSGLDKSLRTKCSDIIDEMQKLYDKGYQKYIDNRDEFENLMEEIKDEIDEFEKQINNKKK